MTRLLLTVLVTFQVVHCIFATHIRQAGPRQPGRNGGLKTQKNVRHCIEEWASGDSEIGFNFPQAKRILRVTLGNIRDPLLCIFGSTYGVTGNTVWVNTGCRAEIRICYEVSPGPIVPRINDPAFKAESFPGAADPLPAAGPLPAAAPLPAESTPPVPEPAAAAPTMPKPEHACVDEWASGDSNIQFEYPIAKEIISVAVDNVGTQSVCLRDTSYGIRNTTVWVNAGCKGKVFVCFHLSVARVARMVLDPVAPSTPATLPVMEMAPNVVEGNVSVVDQTEPNTGFVNLMTSPLPPTTPEPRCIDEWSSGYSRVTFTLPKATRLTYLEVGNIQYDNTCIQGRDYGITGTTVWVDLGCKAEFEICFSIS